ncbi:aldehyde dehydrogenase [Paenibacillus campi]|uniref:aldehyde dehydrogenase n=1 Tax=Paenibacillus campi TaxID=3106031 RepID=UPI002AFDF539|nr:aldehyde dehydrogenase [Paenibacillus sp. SGZ-1014]
MESIQQLIAEQRRFFKTGQSRDLAYRMEALRTLRSGIERYQQRIIDALHTDLNKSEPEAFGSEIRIVLGELDFALEHVTAWAAPRTVPTAAALPDATSTIYPEPYGTTLVIAPWNYPFQLALGPLIGAIAAGNTVVLKPSELTPTVSHLIFELVTDLFPAAYIAVVEGEVEVSTALLKEKFDYIFFTGSTHVGRVVMRAAAEHLTPVTLELGGKSPAIVHEDADLKLAAERLARGKFLNAGQTCVAPDYLLIHSSVKAKFTELLQAEIADKYSDDVLHNPYFPHIVNTRNFDRLTGLMENEQVLLGGRSKRDELLIEPTLLDQVSWEAPIMQEEIFGPILPVIAYDELQPLLDEIVNRPKPLALYLFTQTEALIDEVLSTVSFGGGCVNETLSHMTSHYLPFGGVGESGIGSYHGQQSFEVFSHHKSVLKRNL